MSETVETTSLPALPEPARSTPRTRRGGLAVAFAVAALVLAGYAVWRTEMLARRDDAAQTQRLAGDVDMLNHSIEQLRSTANTLRARLDDGEKVDKSEREELLALTERTRLVEDAVANLADKRLSGRDALLLNEAEMLLTLGGERYALFRDPQATIAAYRLADTALAEVEDAAFSTVRQSISAEIEALSALHGDSASALAARLMQLRTRIAALPAAARIVAAEPQPESASRLWRVLGALVTVRHDDDARALHLRDAGLARELAVLDLRDAEAAAFARDEARFRAAIAAARAELGAFDAAAVRDVRTELDALADATLAPPPPDILGVALKELRNLRATHALGAPPRAAVGSSP